MGRAGAEHLSAVSRRFGAPALPYRSNALWIALRSRRPSRVPVVVSDQRATQQGCFT